MNRDGGVYQLSGAYDTVIARKKSSSGDTHLLIGATRSNSHSWNLKKAVAHCWNRHEHGHGKYMDVFLEFIIIASTNLMKLFSNYNLTLSCDLKMRHDMKVPIVHLWSKFWCNWSEPVWTGAIQKFNKNFNLKMLTALQQNFNLQVLTTLLLQVPQLLPPPPENCDAYVSHLLRRRDKNEVISQSNNAF